MDLFSNWVSVGSGNFSSQAGSIPAFILTTLLSAQIVGIKISTDNAKASWFTGGWLEQLVVTGVDGSTPWLAFYKKLELGGNIIFFPQSINNYSLKISFPAYFKTVNVAVWVNES